MARDNGNGKRPARKGAQRPRRDTKSPKVSPAPPVGVLVAPAHGNGLLWRGPAENHVPGPGRPPNALRHAMRENLEAVVPDLHAKYQAGTIDALEYAQFLAKYVLDARTALPKAAVLVAMQEMADAVRAGVSVEQWDRLAPTLAGIAGKLGRGE
jgi:hypothetical protein